MKLHGDGCIIPNLPVRKFKVILTGTCPHTSLQTAHIVLTAADIDSARSLADFMAAALPQTKVSSVTERR